jgi:ATP-dependent exoDNAse (exonuclease V) beta subunit
MIISKYNYSPLARESVEGKRHYALPDGSRVPSVTTILEKTKPEEAKQKLQEWRNRVGHERAQQITTEAANRGTRMHTYLERYVKNDDIGDFPTNPFAQPSWFMAAKVILEGLQHANEYWGSEVPLYYSGLYAGTTDLVGVWKGQPAIMDFKQSNKVKKREWIDDYFLQLAAYAEAHNDTYGTAINTGVILMCVKPETEQDEPVYQEFVLEPQDFAHWRDQWMRRVELYYLSS